MPSRQEVSGMNMIATITEYGCLRWMTSASSFSSLPFPRAAAAPAAARRGATPVRAAGRMSSIDPTHSSTALSATCQGRSQPSWPPPHCRAGRRERLGLESGQERGALPPPVRPKLGGDSWTRGSTEGSRDAEHGDGACWCVAVRPGERCGKDRSGRRALAPERVALKRSLYWERVERETVGLSHGENIH